MTEKAFIAFLVLLFVGLGLCVLWLAWQKSNGDRRASSDHGGDGGHVAGDSGDADHDGGGDSGSDGGGDGGGGGD